MVVRGTSCLRMVGLEWRDGRLARDIVLILYSGESEDWLAMLVPLGVVS